MNEQKTGLSDKTVTWTGWLQLLFIAFRLAGVIKWSWWWVFAPTWGGIALAVVLFVVVTVIKAISSVKK